MLRWIGVTYIVVLCISGLSAESLFQRSSINLPASISAFEPDYDLDGDGLNDVLVLYQRRVMIFFQTTDGKFPAAPDIEIGSEQPIPQKYAAVSIGKVNPEAGLQLLLLGADGIDFISCSLLRSGNSNSLAPKRLVAEKLDLSSGPELAFVNSAVDMDGDGKPEVAVPQGDKLVFYSSFDGGPYAKAGELGLPGRVQQQTSLDREPLLMGSAIFNEDDARGNVKLQPANNLWHSIRFATIRYTDPLLFLDYNMDRRLDILSAGNIRYQNDLNSFQSSRSSVYRRLMSAMVPHESRNTLVSIPSTADFNDDKLWDSYSVDVSAAKLSPRTDVSIFMGQGQHTLPDKPGQVLRTRDFAYSDSLPLGDVNGDGCLDMALFHLDFQPSSVQSQLKAYLRNGLDGDLRFYLWDKQKNRFPDSPSFKHPIRISYEIYGARQFFRQQVSIHTNVVGDEKPDLVIKTGGMEFSVFENQGEQGFVRRASEVVSTAPTQFKSLQTIDLNSDSVGDVIVSGYLPDQDDRIIYSFYINRSAGPQ